MITLWARPHYMGAVTTYSNVVRGFTPTGAYWMIAQGVLGPNGQPIVQPDNIPEFSGIPQTVMPASCASLTSGAGGPSPACAQALAHYRAFITYQPASRFWAFQGIEATIFIALAATLIAVTAVVLLRRDA